MSVIARSTIKELSEIFAEAAQKAQERNRRKGIPNVYCRGGQVYRESLSIKKSTAKGSAGATGPGSRALGTRSGIINSHKPAGKPSKKGAA